MSGLRREVVEVMAKALAKEDGFATLLGPGGTYFRRLAEAALDAALDVLEERWLDWSDEATKRAGSDMWNTSAQIFSGLLRALRPATEGER